jgi:hypothetical protein
MHLRLLSVHLGMVTGLCHTAVSRSRVTRVRVRVRKSEPLPTPPPVTAGKRFDGGYERLTAVWIAGLPVAICKKKKFHFFFQTCNRLLFVTRCASPRAFHHPGSLPTPSATSPCSPCFPLSWLTPRSVYLFWLTHGRTKDSNERQNATATIRMFTARG